MLFLLLAKRDECGKMNTVYILLKWIYSFVTNEVTDMANEVFGTEESIGEVQIASEVLTAIAGISAAEVEGIEASFGGSLNELAGKLGVKNPSKGVKVEIVGDKVTLDVVVNVRFGYSIPRVSAKIQDKVSQAVNSMTGLEVEKVNVRVAGIAAAE